MRKRALLLLLLFLLSLLLHLFRIEYPAEPVFDEAYFATFAADYVKGEAHFDIHPPLGKLIYALPLVFTDAQKLAQAKFVELKKDPQSDIFQAQTVLDSYGDFPYVRLRIVSALLGALLPLALFWFMKSLGAGDTASFLAAGFLVLENALLVETRLILLNGTYLVFGLSALALYFKKPKLTLLSGAIWGLALSVKLIAVVFLGPVLIKEFLLKDENTGVGRPRAGFFKFLLAGLTVLLVFSLANFLFFTPESYLGSLEEIDFSLPEKINALTPPWLNAWISQGLFTFGNYIGTEDLKDPRHSSWYRWPLMQKSIVYYENPKAQNSRLILSGNPLVWYLSSFSALFAIFLLPRYGKKYFQGGTSAFKPLLILLGGYFFSLFPFMTLVERSTYLYHYFPALIFAIGLGAWLFSEFLEWAELSSRASRLLIAFVSLSALIGFVIAAPASYGF